MKYIPKPCVSIHVGIVLFIKMEVFYILYIPPTLAFDLQSNKQLIIQYVHTSIYLYVYKIV